MKIKFKNAHIITANAGFDVISGGDLCIDGANIGCVGACSHADESFDRVIDCGGDIIMPGLVNAHAHSAMTLLRGIAEGLPLENWLFDRIFPLEARLTPEDVYWGTLLAALEYVRGGVTFTGDAYFFPQAMFAAYDLAGLRCRYVAMPNDIDAGAEQRIAELERNFKDFYNRTPLFSIIPGVHAEYTCSEKFLHAVADFAAVNRQPLYTHMSETLKEVGDCTVRRGGLTPPQYLHKIGFFENGGTVAHAVHTDKDDIDLLVQSGVSVAHNPASNLKLASGVAPVYSMLQRGLNVCLGTDGAASNNALDIFREMYLMSVLQKSEMGDAAAVPAKDVILAATISGARALFEPSTGSLEPGKQADIIRVSVSGAHFRPKNDITSHLVYSGKSSDVCMTMVAGKILYEDGNYNIGIDPQTVYDECELRIRRLERPV